MKKIIGIAVVCLFLAAALTVNAQIVKDTDVFTDLNATLTGIGVPPTINALGDMDVRATVAGNDVLIGLGIALESQATMAVATGQACLIDVTVDFDPWGITGITVNRLTLGVDPLD